jgi:hypothetical protein
MPASASTDIFYAGRHLPAQPQLVLINKMVSKDLKKTQKDKLADTVLYRNNNHLQKILDPYSMPYVVVSRQQNTIRTYKKYIFHVAQIHENKDTNPSPISSF